MTLLMSRVFVIVLIAETPTHQARHQYGLFNLLVGDAHGIHYITNGMMPAQTELPHGIYGMSNALLDSPWGKLLRGMPRKQPCIRKSSQNAI
jgi:uncharacterized protein with NRDE domain